MGSEGNALQDEGLGRKKTEAFVFYGCGERSSLTCWNVKTRVGTTLRSHPHGEVAERAIAPVSKAGVHFDAPGVRIPPSPHLG